MYRLKQPIRPLFRVRGDKGDRRGRLSLRETHLPGLLMRSGPYGCQGIWGNLPPLLPNGFLDSGDHRRRHLDHIAHKRLPLLRIHRPLAGCFDLGIKRRFLSVARGSVREAGRDWRVILATIAISHGQPSIDSNGALALARHSCLPASYCFIGAKGTGGDTKSPLSKQALRGRRLN